MFGQTMFIRLEDAEAQLRHHTLACRFLWRLRILTQSKAHHRAVQQGKRRLEASEAKRAVVLKDVTNLRNLPAVQENKKLRKAIPKMQVDGATNPPWCCR